MQNNIPRRSFLLAWLGGLLSGWLGRPQAHAAPTPAPAPTELLLVATRTDKAGLVTTYILEASEQALRYVGPGDVQYIRLRAGTTLDASALASAERTTIC